MTPHQRAMLHSPGAWVLVASLIPAAVTAAVWAVDRILDQIGKKP